jgi:hypothetical protein
LNEVEEKFDPMIDYKYLTIASGATPIGSAGRAPDEDGNIGYYTRVQNRLHHQWQTSDNKLDFTPIRRDLRLSWIKTTQRSWALKQPNKDHDKNSDSQAAPVAIKRLNDVVAKIMKVRPQDPSCMA